MDRIGFHVSTAGGVSNAFLNADAVGCTSMQIFLSSPQMWEVRTISKEEKARFIKHEKAMDIRPVFVHMPYLPNLASPNPLTHKRSVETLISIARSCSALGIGHVVVHLGSHLGKGQTKGMEDVVAAVNSALDVVPDVQILLEDQAGQKNSVGSSMEDLKEIYKELSSRNVGICLDTCHLFAAGYDIGDHAVLERIEHIVGFSNVKLIHLNDAQFELGSGRDRHERIGFGEIGEDGIRTFLSYRKVRGIPLIMETPHESAESQIRELALVRKLMQ